jgi:hypothetical protein
MSSMNPTRTKQKTADRGRRTGNPAAELHLPLPTQLQLQWGLVRGSDLARSAVAVARLVERAAGETAESRGPRWELEV